MSILRTELPFPQYIIDVVGTTTFAYYLFAALMVIYLNGYSSRIDFSGFALPHASKIALWTAYALIWLKPRFGYRFPAAVSLLYCLSELITNWIYVPVHLVSEPGYFAQWELLFGVKQNYYFVLSNIFFILGLGLSYLILYKRYEFKVWDWAWLPFITFIAIWVSQGYITDSTLQYATPFSEFMEFTWSVLYLLAMHSIFKPRVKP